MDRILHTATDLIDRAANLDFDALAITLHDAQLNDRRVFDYARDRGITLVPGIERTIEGRHVLLLNFPSAAAESVCTFEDLARLRAKHGGGIVIAPHPFFPDRSCLRSRLAAHAELFDAVEWSYFWTRGIDFNTRAERWAREHGKALVGNSDLHDLRQFGRTFSLVDAAPEPSAICDAIRAGRVTVQTTPVPVPELVDVFGRMTIRGMVRTILGARSQAPELSSEGGL